MLHSWQTLWEQAETGRSTFLFLNNVNTTRLSGNKYVNAFLTNHGPFIQYLNRFHLNESEICCCGQIGNAYHYLFNCTITKHMHLKKPSGTTFDAWTNLLLKHKGMQSKMKCLYEWLDSNNEHLILT